MIYTWDHKQEAPSKTVDSSSAGDVSTQTEAECKSTARSKKQQADDQPSNRTTDSSLFPAITSATSSSDTPSSHHHSTSEGRHMSSRDLVMSSSRDLSMTALVNKVSHREALSEIYLSNLSGQRACGKISLRYSHMKHGETEDELSLPQEDQESDESNTDASYLQSAATDKSPEKRDVSREAEATSGSEDDSGICQDAQEVLPETHISKSTHEPTQPTVSPTEKANARSIKGSLDIDKKAYIKKSHSESRNSLSIPEKKRVTKDSELIIPYRLSLESVGKKATPDDTRNSSSAEGSVAMDSHFLFAIPSTRPPLLSNSSSNSSSKSIVGKHRSFERISRMQEQLCIPNNPANSGSKIMFMDAFASRKSYPSRSCELLDGLTDKQNSAVKPANSLDTPQTHRLQRKIRKKSIKRMRSHKLLSPDNPNYDAMKKRMFELSIQSHKEYSHELKGSLSDSCLPQIEQSEIKALKRIKKFFTPRKLDVEPIALKSDQAEAEARVKKAAPLTQSSSSIKKMKRMYQPKIVTRKQQLEQASTSQDVCQYVKESPSRSLQSSRTDQPKSKLNEVKTQGISSNIKNAKTASKEDLIKNGIKTFGGTVTGQAATILNDRSQHRVTPENGLKNIDDLDLCTVQIGDYSVVLVDHFKIAESSAALSRQVQKHVAGNDESSISTKPPPNTPLSEAHYNPLTSHHFVTPYSPHYDRPPYTDDNPRTPKHPNVLQLNNHADSEFFLDENDSELANARHIDVHLPKVSMCASPDGPAL